MKKTKLITVLLFLNLFTVILSFGQGCPQNIGFESGTFLNWKTYTGSVSVSPVTGTNVIKLVLNTPLADRHLIMKSKTAKDPYGGFPVLAPNGSSFSLKLGNDGTNKQAEGVSYLINVPKNNPSFYVTYQYAVVFQDPGHPLIEQPRFEAKILDVSTNTYISCASFEFVATSSLPGFKVSAVNSTVIYKDWTAVTINLNGYQGKQVILEFKTADCTRNAHFGYAYIDVDENCQNAVSGTKQCKGSTMSIFEGPSGYQSYKWYNADKSILYGEGEKIKIKPALANGQKVFLDLIPFEGFGCPNTLSFQVDEYTFDLNLLSLDNVCKDDLVDLTSTKYILNKSAQATYTYFSDAALKVGIPDPTQIKTSGIYYVVATLPTGCSSVKSIQLIFNEIDVEVLPSIKICSDAVLDLTSTVVQRKVPGGLTITYFSDAALTSVLLNPKNITLPGDYYIKYQSQYCTVVKKVNVSIYPLPLLKVIASTAVCAPNVIDLTQPNVTLGSDAGLSFTYFKDAAHTEPLTNPKAIDITGDYYIQATNSNGCTASASIHVEINPLPELALKNPASTCAPYTVDITDPALYAGSTAGVNFTYLNRDGTTLSNPKAITKSGNFLVRIKSLKGCEVTKEIEVTVYVEKPVIKISNPNKVFISQSVDLTNPAIIAGSSGYVKVDYWKDELMNVRLSNPNAVTIGGKYYISITNNTGCTSVAPVDVVMVELPKIIAPSAFTPLKSTNNLFFPFYQGIQKLLSFKIYNKWGNLVYETSSMNQKDGWNGTYRNVIQPAETYTWFAEGINLLDFIYTARGKTILIP